MSSCLADIEAEYRLPSLVEASGANGGSAAVDLKDTGHPVTQNLPNLSTESYHLQASAGLEGDLLAVRKT